LFTFLLIVQTLVAASLVTVILMQRSEGGGLVASSGGSLMSARGAADFLTRATAVLATLFIVLSIILAALAAVQRAPTAIDASLARPAPSGPLTGSPAAPITGAPPSPNNDPLAGAAEQGAGAVAPAPIAPALGNQTVPAQKQ
jgi:preprotein translocase subunit SecG